MNNEEKILAILEEHTKQFKHINTTLEINSKDIKDLKSSINGINSSINSINTTLKTHSENIKDLKSSINNINNTLKAHSEDIRDLKSSINGINFSINSINTTLETHSKDIKIMKSSIINTEAYVREKIPTLFDAITVNSDKHELYDDHIASLNAKTFNHNIRISSLEDTLRPLTA